MTPQFSCPKCRSPLQVGTPSNRMACSRCGNVVLVPTEIAPEASEPFPRYLIVLITVAIHALGLPNNVTKALCAPAEEDNRNALIDAKQAVSHFNIGTADLAPRD